MRQSVLEMTKPITESPEGTERLASFIEEFSYRDLPQQVVEKTKDVLYDGLGALLSATSPRYTILGVLERFLCESGGRPESQVFGSALRTSCVNAALVNGTLGYYCDVESHHAGAIMHAIAVVGPSALAVGERQGSSGREVLAAIALGIEIACRVSHALDPRVLYARGFHPTCVAGTFGSMAAAALLLGLKGKELRNALGLAGTVTSGLLAWAGDPTEHSRPFNMGLASRNGTFAAHLASCGLGGPPSIFEGKYPLGQAFTGRWNEAALLHGLGTRFRVMELYFKLYACCAFIHPGLDGLLDILEQESIIAEEIEAIQLRFPAGGYKIIDNNPLRSHNAQYILALAAWRGEVDFFDVLHDQRFDPGIGRLSQRIEVLGDRELDVTYPDLYRSVIRVLTRNGHTYERDVTYPKGSPQNPLSRSTLQEKFTGLTRDVLTPEQVEEITDSVEHLERLPRITRLSRLLAKTV